MSSAGDLVEYIAKAVVDYPDDVEVKEHRRGRSITLRLLVADSDMGRVIGKQGRMANAMRTLLEVAAAKQDSAFNLEIGR